MAESGFRFETLQAHDGLSLRAAHWPLDTGRERRGSVLLFGGYTEFIEKYTESAGDFIARGYDVFSMDWRGQGRSDRLLTDRHKGHIDAYENHLRDLEVFVDTLVKPNTDAPIAIVAHSMGGHIILRFLHDHPEIARHAVLSAPMVDINFGPLPPGIAKAIVGTASALGFRESYSFGSGPYRERPFENNRLTHDATRYARTASQIRTDPELALGGPTFGWAVASMRSIATLASPGYPEAIRTPVLIVSAAEERVVSNAAQARLIRRMPKGELVPLSGARHEILMETDDKRAVFLDHFDRFVAAN